jgi:hypothetical protein
MSKKQVEEVVTSKESKEFDPDGFVFKTIQDYDTFNKWARKNKRPVRVPTEDFYPKRRIKFMRMDGQKENVLKARVRRRHIDWTGQLKHGHIYHLCDPVIEFLNSLSTPVFAEVEIRDNGPTRRETRQVSEDPRFSCQVLDFVAA